jgi:hypothetical protein
MPRRRLCSQNLSSFAAIFTVKFTKVSLAYPVRSGRTRSCVQRLGVPSAALHALFYNQKRTRWCPKITCRKCFIVFYRFLAVLKIFGKLSRAEYRKKSTKT